ncbi:UDP-glycosyltransferase UGT5-like isoform X1 [Battus philenor]|uniref:UDP-glycosyltransferase UGT5-like isoform X1 n=1 Tax=Battus philenor TaxID=42288 RepID=UPI0035CEAF79
MRALRTSLIAFVLTALACPGPGHSARILGLFPHFGKSHYMVFQPLLRTLAERGHQVTTVSFFPLENPPQNYTDVRLESSVPHGVESLDISIFKPNPLMNVPILNTFLQTHGTVSQVGIWALKLCKDIIGQPAVAEALKQKYDVVLMENFNSDCMFGLMNVYGLEAPVIALSSCLPMPWTPTRFGLPDNPAYVPLIATPYTSKMTFKERFETFFLKLYLTYWYHEEVQEKERAMIEKYFGKTIPDLEELGKKYTSILLVNTFPTLNGVRPLLPSIIEVGGMHLDHSKKVIPSYIERFLNESEHGVILLSFGSLIKTATIPKYKEEIIVNTLSKLKQRVIWKYEDSGEEGTLSGNILRVKWLPQYELLQHKKIVAFIAHGGLLGMTEAISAGKPMVVVPFFGDQPANAAAAAAVGFAKVVPYLELNEKALTEALAFVLSAETRVHARRISSIWRDRQADPLETAVYWTERVIRWGNTAPLHSAARDMPLYQVALLDVIAAFIVAILILLAISWYTLSMVFRLLFGKESKLKMN